MLVTSVVLMHYYEAVCLRSALVLRNLSVDQLDRRMFAGLCAVEVALVSFDRCFSFAKNVNRKE